MSQTGRSSDREQLEIAVWQESPDSVIVVLSGELDVATAAKVHGCLADLYKLGITNMVMDLANLAFIDSVGLSVLIMVAKRVRTVKGTLTVRNANQAVIRPFEMTGLMSVLSVNPDDDRAIVAGPTEPVAGAGAA